MRLLWLIDSFNVGGAESLAVTFARRADRSRIELFVAALGSVGGNPLEKEFRDAGVPTINLGARSLRDPAAFRRLVEFVREHRITLVHAHLTYAAIWSAWLSRATGVPSLASLHVAVSATQGVERSRLRRAAVTVRDWIMCFALRRWSSGVIFVSGFLRAEYASRLHGASAHVVHNGIEVERFARDRTEARSRIERELGVPDAVPLLVSVTVLRAGKGIDVLLRALCEVPDAHLVIIGDGPMGHDWRRIAEEAGVAGRVHWAGHRRDVDALLAGFDLFVHPSLDDAFPTVLLEACAASLPIVASAIGGIPEIVNDGENGMLVTAGDETKLGAAIRSLLADRTRMERMSEAARRLARERFSVEAWMARLDRVYAEVLR
jgi:glycosyltransferase involved in cell wall biosynthesis